MSYEKQVWSKYDALKPEDENIENGAVVTDSRMNHMENGISDSSSTVENHIANKLNPHSVTKNQVGLGNVQNFGLATEDEAKQGDSNAKYMTPSLTQAVLSANINSIAYANSSDGTDGFTTVYPNLNLFTGTSDKPSISTGGDWNATVIGVYKTPKVGQEYTLSVEVPEADHDVKMEAWRWNNAGRRVSLIDTKLIKSGEKTHITFTWPAEDFGATQIACETGWINDTDTGTYSYRKAKLEEGSIATPHMPSASEVTTADWPKYVGFSNTVKTNKSASDYVWFPDLTNKVEDHVNNRSNPHGVTASQVGSYTKSEVATLISEAIKQSKLDANPIGTILTTISNTNPSTYIGGTWERFANGRTLVGVDETDDVTLMKTANKMGGSTNPITEHRHDFGKVGSQQTYTYAWGTGNYATGQVYAIGSQLAPGSAPNNNLLTRQHADLGGTTNSGNNTDHNNWQPFATVYFWRRTA